MTNSPAFFLTQPGSNISFGSVLLRLCILIVIYVLFFAAQRFLVKNRILKSFGRQLNILVLGLLMLLLLKPVLIQMHPYVLDSIHVIIVFMGVSIVVNLLDLFVFDIMVRRRNKPPVPKVLRDIGRWTFFLFASLLIVRGFFPGVNLSMLAVSSLVAGYIVGNATQDTLGNLVAGLALNAESPFEIGDWVTMGSHTGMVVNTNWRATCLRTKAEDNIIIPNASVARESIINYSRPTGCHGCYVKIGVDYATAPDMVQNVILDVLKEIPSVMKMPVPSIFLSEYDAFRINYTIKFFINDFAQLDPIQSIVMSRLWYGFKRAGINIPTPIRNVHLHDEVLFEKSRNERQFASVLALLNNVEIFQSLSADEHKRLAEAARLEQFGTGETLCREGDKGDSFYIISRGSVSVSIKGEHGGVVPVAHLGVGAFFGEMSLLTGETRSATVMAESNVEVYNVSKSAFAGLIQSNAALADTLAGILEKRSSDRHSKRSAVPEKKTVIAAQHTLASRIRRFFGID